MALKPNKFKGGVQIENNQTLDLFEASASGTSKITLKGPAALSADTDYILPADGPANAVLQTDGSGNLTWTTGVGSGGINYITNYDAAVDTAGWATYDDGAVADPVDGTGGSSANLTFTRNTSSPLRGTSDFDLAKGAADAQGEGVSYDFTIDSADQARVLRISFDYTVSTNYADDDMRVQIYDVTNSALIQTVGRDIKAISGQGKHIAEFQSASNSTSYRLILHVSSTNASSYQLNFDNVEVGPREVARGSVITDWEAFTPTGTWSTNTTYVGKRRRVGDSLEMEVTVNLSGAPNAATLEVNIPSGLTIDTTKLSDSTTTIATVGNCTILDSGTNVYSVSNVSYTDTNTVRPRYDNGNGIASVINATSPITFASGDYVQLQVKLPIVGWSANSEISSDFGSRVVACRAFLGSAFSQTASGSFQDVPLDTASFDTCGSFVAASGHYVVPESGVYQVSAAAALTSIADASRVSIKIVASTYGDTIGTSSINGAAGATAASVSALMNLVKGETVKVQLLQSDTSSEAVVTGNDNTYFSIHKVQSPQSLIGSEAVVVIASDNAGQSQTALTTNITWSTTEFDTHSSWNGTTFTAPYSGVYSISGNVSFNSPAAIRIDGYINGTQTKRVGDTHSEAQCNLAGMFKLNKGQQLTFRVTSTTSLLTTNAAVLHTINIHKL